MTPIPISIRRATAEDCPRLLELVAELAAYERAPDAVTVTPEAFARGGFGPNPVWWAFVAECQGRIEAFALYYIRFSTWRGCRMYLEDLYVTPALRGRGIGRRLFDRLIEEAREREFDGIVWQVLAWNTPAIGFYERCGATFDPEWINGALDLGR